MSEVVQTMTADTSGLESAIRDVVPLTSRTMAEQCVTSMGMILQDLQNYGDNQIPYVSLGRMDAELDAPAKNTRLAELGYTVGDEVVMARASPDSNYNKITGSRWAITLPKTASIRGFGRAYGAMNAAQMFLDSVLRPIKERMRKARHSSGHFLQSGFKWATEICVTSDLFKNRYRKQDAVGRANPLNTLSPTKLGGAVMSPVSGTTFSVKAFNNVGDRDGSGNAVLDAKHRQALIAYATGPVQRAISKEEGIQVAELNKRLDAAYEKINKQLA